MKKMAAVLLVALALAVAAVPALPAPAEARGGGNFWTGFAVGTATGLVVSPVFYPRYYYAPPPVYYYPPAPVYAVPAPVCYRTYAPGYWASVPVYDGFGYTSYQYQWVPPRAQTVCR